MCDRWSRLRVAIKCSRYSAPVEDDLATLDGTLGRVVYRDDDSHFTVARFLVPGQVDPITVVGELVQITGGAPLRLRRT